MDVFRNDDDDDDDEVEVGTGTEMLTSRSDETVKLTYIAVFVARCRILV